MMGGSIEYIGELNDHTIEGLFKQSGMEFNLNLTKGEMKKPGNTKLPSTDEELKALAAKEKANTPMQLMTILLSQNHLHFNYLQWYFHEL